MTNVAKVQLVVEGPLGGDSDDEALSRVGDAVMDALIELGVEDPFVSISAEPHATISIHVVVKASSGSQALAIGMPLVEKAMLAAGYEQTEGDDMAVNASARRMTVSLAMGCNGGNFP